MDKSPVANAQHLERFFSLSLDLLCVTDANAKFVDLNPRWCQLLGWSESELRSQSLLARVHPADRAATEGHLQSLPESGDIASFENRLITKEGEVLWLRWAASTGDEGMIYAAGTDMTDQRHAQSAASEHEKMFEAVLQAAVDPVIVIDATGTILIANRATSTLFGYSQRQLEGQNVSILMPEPFRSEHDHYLQRYLRTGERRIIGLGREVVAQRADGTTMPIALAVSEVDIPGSAPMFTGIIHDLTSRVEAEERLKSANELLEERVAERTTELERSLAELSRSNRDLEQFAYIASHDLQTPLRNVRQGLELLDEHLLETLGNSFDEEAQELRSLIVRAVGRMEDLINGLLAYARVEREAASSRGLVDLNLIASDLHDLLQADLDRIGASLIIHDLPTVPGNAAQLRQVLANLVGNALKYRRDRTETVVEVRAELVDDHWTLSVCDNGIGLAEDQHTRIFELFRRGHAGYDGVGIGLAICQRIVEQHGGEIWVESEPNHGAMFNFTIPARDLADS